MTAAEQVKALSELSAKNASDRGGQLVVQGEARSRLLLLWVGYLEKTKLTKTADCLLFGMSSALRESVACLVLGLGRQSLSSLRLQVDLLLSWLYFKDHPVEWGRVQETGDGFKLKKDLLQYLSENHARYGTRFGLLKQCMTRSLEDPFRLLSAHMHGQSESALPLVENLKDVVSSVSIQDDVLALIGEVSEYLGDVLWSVYASDWMALPDELKTALKARFKTDAARAEFFKS